jgi:hypothetical protein
MMLSRHTSTRPLGDANSVQRDLDVTAERVRELVKAVRTARRGPSGSPIVTRESFENFLIGRLQ